MRRQAIGGHVFHAEPRHRRRPVHLQSPVQGSQHAHRAMGVRRRRLQSAQRLLRRACSLLLIATDPNEKHKCAKRRFMHRVVTVTLKILIE